MSPSVLGVILRESHLKDIVVVQVALLKEHNCESYPNGFVIPRNGYTDFYSRIDKVVAQRCG